MSELKGKLDTTYVWTCEACQEKCSVVDAQMVCAHCGKLRTDERFLRHFKLTPEPIRLGFRT